ncbi:ThuA domain-containing protein [Streptomyces sp. NBC_01102]|uniref:ThuA domain-containing protein n=1 Tax=Streptomyces sp. NBC_01102 TaxID=2903749 RepID=UPI00386C0BC3|nr:ThuA domain-containing protein [Streptomyces sp. NBC_01102]
MSSRRPLRSSPAPQAFPPPLIALIAILALILGSMLAASHRRAHAAPFRVLVYSESTNASHGPVPAGIRAVRELGAENGFDVEATSSSAVFNDTDLARFQAVVFNNTEATPGEGRLLEADERAALRSYIRAGGGWVGLHAAAGDGSDWDWYAGLTGAVLDRSTPVRTGRIDVLDHAHPSTSGLPDLWERTEEWYDWRADPASDVHTLARIKVRDGLTGLDEGRDHPWSWCQNYDGGRSWFTAGGHVARSFREEGFLDHLLGGIEWAAGAKPGDCSATRTGSFRRTALATDGLADPVDLAVAPDLRVFFAERAGKVKVVDQRSMRVSTAIDFAYAPETVDRSGGLVGLTLDPAFARNGRLYVLRSEKAGNRLLLSRFTVSGNTAEPASEKRLLTVPVGTGKKGSREGSSPVSASLAFDAKGVLHTATPAAADLSVADDPNDLRGKILRIVPQDDGTYTVPEGNLHAPGTAGTRPEIYATGLRHPYRIAADPRSGALLVADQGPEGTVGYLRITEAGVVGRPYCADGATTRRTGPALDCAAPVGGPPRATRAVTTAPVTDAPLSGSVYDHDPAVSERTAFPAYFDGKWLSYDPVGRRFTTLSFTRADQTFTDPRFDPVDAGALQSVDGAFEDMEWHRPTAARFGPDGSLYVVDHGLDGGTGPAGGNEGAGVHRIDYAGDGGLPEATITADRDNGSAPLTVAFDSAGSGLHGKPPVTYAWDFDGDGTTDSTAANPSHTYRGEGRFTARLTVTGPGGTTALAGQEITVGNSRPELTLRQQHGGGLFTFGDTLAFTVAVTDRDGGEPEPVDCSRVVVRSRLGTGTPLRPVARPPGCRGEIVTAAGDRHGRDPDLPYTLTARYTDRGAPALTGSASLTLRTAFREAEHFAATGGAHGGAVAAGRTNASGGRTLTEIEDGDWIAFDPVHLGNVDSVMVGAIACGIGGTIDFRAGSPTGRLLGSVSVAGTGSRGAIVSPTTALEDPGAGVRLYVVFTNAGWSSERSDLFTVDWLHFRGPGNRRKPSAARP